MSKHCGDVKMIVSSLENSVTNLEKMADEDDLTEEEIELIYAFAGSLIARMNQLISAENPAKFSFKTYADNKQPVS